MLNYSACKLVLFWNMLHNFELVKRGTISAFSFIDIKSITYHYSDQDVGLKIKIKNVYGTTHLKKFVLLS